MTLPRLTAVAVALLCGCILVVTGCGPASTSITTVTTITAGSAVVGAETAQLYPVRVDGKWGFIDKTGTVKIEPQFAGVLRYGDRIEGFSEGLAAVAVGENDDEKWGYIDKTGAWVIEPRFDNVYSFSEGLAAVQRLENGTVTYGCIDTSGAMVIPPRQCTGAGPFSGDMAALLGLGSADRETPSCIDKTRKVIWQAQ